MRTLRAATFLLTFLSLPAIASETVNPAGPSKAEIKEEINEDRRRDTIKTFNYNGDERLKGKEMRMMERERPRMYENLMAFCDRALEAPKKNGVVFTDEKDERKSKCKTRRVEQSYYAAWARGGDTPREEKAENKEIREEVLENNVDVPPGVIK